MKALVVKTNGTSEVIDQEWNYNQINIAVGGLIQPVYFPNYKAEGYINEEGKILGLEENVVATNTWYNSGARILLGDYLAGDIVFFGEVDEEGNNTDVTPEIVEAISNEWEKVYA